MRAKLESAMGKTTEWKRSALRAYQRRAKQADCNDQSRFASKGDRSKRLMAAECSAP